MAACYAASVTAGDQINRGLTREQTQALSYEEMRALGFCGKLMADKLSRCRNFAGARTDHPGFGACRYHGGNREGDRMAAAKEELKTQSLTLSVEIEPVAALRASLHMAAGAVAYCQLRIRSLEQEEVDLEFDEHGFHANAKSRMLSTWMALYANERDRLATVAAACLKAGVAERHVRAVENRAGIIGDALSSALAAPTTPLSPQQIQEVLTALRVNLTSMAALDAQAVDGSRPSSALPTKVARDRADRTPPPPPPDKALSAQIEKL